MLPVSLVQQVKQLLEEGKLSQRKIAKQLGVSRGTVAAIASGKRGLHGRETKMAGDEPFNQGPPQRCPSCGHLVYMPCVMCRAIDYANRRDQANEQQKSTPDRQTPKRPYVGPQPESSTALPLRRVA